ncbi:putative K(+)-stimulated pyrophosphate-energized sodium pump [Clostridium homopropionicum DSM 5847]|uniref:Putative K(+)-stimulated pyrophosphate-energized sodium pump n=1 Tax=Clostridium homopropionicum DSM 5847 TaxID=1121318 RepID=A0A0L6ZD81_9CLOT|nr:sodium-translocating pyrophosphatase [Clostridium homopropionicum]KOA20738.1 putative K(+)-stimulated pyrophosphate-energized sodium pump [Clostridium homopropionicum DSM 5847]SFF90283.1 K(+)-stimulated pyrophosphate-energized sodium pump [Clostridium homopropionicum]
MNSYLPIVCGILALIFAFILTKGISKEDPGNERMKEISGYIHEGAMAFLKREYRYLSVFIVVVAIIIILAVDYKTAICFVFGAVFSILAGYCGMNVATKANVRTAQAATEGQRKALKIAFSGGAVMGMCVVGLGIFGLALLYIILGNDPNFITGFGLGASSIALFARVGGGIYTKAADVGADLVGKVEAGIPEDDPRNPAVIADNVGDNVGDVAGMGADLFESYVGSIISALTLGYFLFSGEQSKILFPLMLASVGVIASIIGAIFARNSKNSNPQKTLNHGTYIGGVLVIIGSLSLSISIFGDSKAFFAILAGLIVGISIGKITEIYTSDEYRFVRRIAKQSETGEATTIISGFAVGMYSTMIPIVLICAGVLFSFYIMGGGENIFMGLYGISLAAVGMLSTTGLTVAVDAYGPIADNAGGIAEMSGLPSSVREITDKLDSVGNTTAAIGKGFAIGSAALTALALFASYAQKTELTAINLLTPVTLVGVLIGAMLPFLFGALTMESVGKAANHMIEEVRHQFKTIPGIMEGKAKPDYKKCVDISTSAALKEMILPGVLAIVVPIAVGMLLGVEALGGLIGGAVSSGVLIAIMMANAGGAWDNAKKFIERGAHGGKGSDAHKAAVVGDTVGDPFKDTSGPAMNILIKLMTIVSLVFATVIANNGGILLRLFN